MAHNLPLNLPNLPPMLGGQFNGHRWRFFRSGGFDQVRLDSGDDLRNLPQLDQKLWTTLASPASGLEFDARTLALIDTDHDGRIRAPEILAAVQWAVGLLRDPAVLTQGSSTLPLAAINESTDEGKLLLAAARQILRNRGREAATEISVDDTADLSAIFANTPLNGDGVIPVYATSDAALQAVLRQIIDTQGAVADRGGDAGVSSQTVAAFYDQAQAYVEWAGRAASEAAIMPLGDATAAAWAAVSAVRAKVDDYFTRCQLAAFDARAAQPLARTVEDYAAVAGQQLDVTHAGLAAFPLAAISAEAALPLLQGTNPAWSAALETLRTQAVVPIMGEQTQLTLAQWRTLTDRLAAHGAWQSTKPATGVEKLGVERLRDLLAGSSRAQIESLIAADKALEAEAQAMAAVDKLLRFNRDLFKLLTNFVSFRDFYTVGTDAIFQAGTLYIDGRACRLCIRVDNVAKHSALAHLARTYLVYCALSRKATGETMTIVAAVTAGGSDNLMVGRNGIFYDRQGRDWDATITHIIDNPISVRQAIWAPYKRIARLINEQVQKFAASKAKTVEESSTSTVAGTAAVVKTSPAAPPFDVAKFAGIFAAVGMAIGALGTALAAVVTGLLSLSGWQLPLALLGLGAAISGPSAMIAFFKLRERNLAPILDANGWAINTQAKINLVFGAALTSVAELPQGAERALTDPFAEKEIPWKKYVLEIVLLLAVLGGLYYFRAAIWERLSAGRSAGSTPESAPAAVTSPAQ